jgi:TonB-linked SusC/RagA family outer membrane protein
MRKILTLLGGVMLLLTQLYAQNRTVTGTVTDDKGQPLANVSVVLKPSGGGTVTDDKGKFVISVPTGARTIQFSSVNYTDLTMSIGNKTTIDAKLAPEDKTLAEVVVVGYGTQKRKEVTGSIASVKGAAIANLPVQSFDAALGGRAAGVQITVPNGVLNNPPVFRIRGTNSINLSSYPLIIIDGVPSYTGDVSANSAASNALASLNPNDIESIEVLKDASAAAIYGSRAANGVVQITTKKGKAGTAKVTYDGTVGWTSAYGLWDLMNAQQYMALKNEALDNAGIPATGPGSTRYLPTNGPDGNPIDTRWYDYVYRTGIQQNHNVAISGGNASTTYYFSAGFTKQEGMLIQNDFTRKVVRMNVDHRVNKVFSLGGSFNYSNEQNIAPNTGSLPGQAFNTSGIGRIPLVTAPNVAPLNNNGSYNINANNQVGVMNNNAGQVGFTNPLALVDLNRQLSENNRVQGNLYANIKPVSWLTLRTQFGIDYLNTDNELFYSPVHGDGFPGGNATSSLAKYRRWVWTNTATFDKKFGEHSVNLILGNEQQDTKSNGFGLARTVIADPFFTDITGGFTTPNPSGVFRGINYFLSSFASLKYDYKKKYFLGFNGRTDEYSAFGDGNKKGNFWGVSGAWEASKENFWATAGLDKVFNSFKVKASYGTVGNLAGIGDFAALSTYGSGLYGANSTLLFNNAGNPALQWETSKKTDYGITFGLLNDKITGEITYYNNDIDGLIFNVPQAPSRGIPGNSIQENVGAMYNRGWEFTFNSTPIRKKDFSWTTSVNFTTNDNKVTALAPGTTQFTSATSGLETVNITRVGHPVGSLFVVRTAGVNPANGRRIFINAAGQMVQYSHVVPSGQSRWTFMDGTTAPSVGSQDAQLYANSIPKWFGGFDNTFKYKDFDLNLLMTFQGGYSVYNGTQAGLRDMRFWNNHTDVLRRWTKAGDVTDIPRVVFGDNVSNGSAFPQSQNVEKADFLKIRNATLGYTLPRKLLDKAKISSARLYVSGQNLAIFSGYSGPDPEVSTNGNGNTGQGVDRNSVANARTILIGINVSF